MQAMCSRKAAMIFLLFALSCVADAAPMITEYALPAAYSAPGAITLGSDGALWFLNYGSTNAAIGRITPQGVITEFPVPTANVYLIGIASGADGNLWFTEMAVGSPSGGAIGRITSEGNITEFPIAQTPGGICAGPDGNLWFVGTTQIGRITTAGAITWFDAPNAYGGDNPGNDIAAGADGNVWFTEASYLGRITPRGTLTEFGFGGIIFGGLVAGGDGNIWFTETYSVSFAPALLLQNIGRISPSGVAAAFIVPTAASGPYGITAGHDNKMWFTEPSANNVGSITYGGDVQEYPVPTPMSSPTGIVSARDGSLWFTEEYGNKIGEIAAAAAPNVASSPASSQLTLLALAGLLVLTVLHRYARTSSSRR